MTETIIRARGISKSYRVYDRRSDRFWELLLRRHRHHEFQALKEVSFELARGESLGLVGENGAGKSTLLKILAGIVQPSSGEIEVNGRVASILELGSGFHPEMTGRQNIVLNAAMLGLTEERLRQRLPDIIAFSELGDFIEQPVKCYSTGMVMRLGFAIATQVDPDILIIDEALAVGDGYFQKKCVDRLQEMHAAGTTFLFCSHAMYFVTTLCSQALWLRGGRIAAHGQSHEVVQEYEAFLHSKETRPVATGTASSSRPAAAAGTPARLTRVALRDATQTPTVVRPGAPLVIEIEWTSREAGLQYHLGVGINRGDGVVVTFVSTLNDGLPAFRGQTSYRVELELPALPLTKGEFALHVFLGDEDGLHVFDQRLLDSAFKIGGDRYTPGLLEIEHRWLLGAEAVIAAPASPPSPARAAAAGPR